jgi:hypothetical protein
MDIHEEGFFREATLRICGSLNISTAISHCYEYLKDFFSIQIKKP